MILLEKIIPEQESYYTHPIRCVSEEDKCLLDNSKTTGMIQFGVKHMPYPKFWRDEKFKLPFNIFQTKKYKNAVFETVGDRLPYYDEGSRVKLVATKKPTLFLEKVLPALNFGGNMWQHFIQDVLPIIFFNKEILMKDPKITLLMYDIPDKKMIDFVLSKLGIFNPRHYIGYKSSHVISTNELFNFECNVEIPTYFWPSFFYKEINSSLLKDENFICKNVIFNRRTKTRKILNESQVLEYLKIFCEKKDLNLILFEAEKLSIQDRFEIYKNAHTVVAPHGGANYNIIFSNCHARFIESVFTDCMYTLYNLASGLEIDYYLLPHNGTNHSAGINIDIDKLTQAMET